MGPCTRTPFSVGAARLVVRQRESACGGWWALRQAQGAERSRSAGGSPFGSALGSEARARREPQRPRHAPGADGVNVQHHPLDDQIRSARLAAGAADRYLPAHPPDLPDALLPNYFCSKYVSPEWPLRRPGEIRGRLGNCGGRDSIVQSSATTVLPR